MRGQQHRAWWLLLALLMQGSLLPQPLRTHAARSNTFIFHHGHKVGHVGAQTPGAPRRYSPLTQTDVDRAAFIIRQLIDSSKVQDGSHPFLAGFVRLIFHDCVGVRCDGCINTNYGPNAGLAPYLSVLEKTYGDRNHRLYEKMSQADFWALAGLVAAQAGAAHGGGTLTTTFRTGRMDCASSPSTAVRDAYPDAHGGAHATLDYWRGFFGFTYYETVALLGAHGLGRCHRDGSGFDGAWTTDKDALDNAYYRDLSNDRLGWMQQRVDDTHVQWVHGDGSAGMMLNADMALWKDIDPQPRESQCAYSTCGPSPVAGTVGAFANDNALFLEAFSGVFEKMIEHGYTREQLTEVLPAPSPPPPLPQSPPANELTPSLKALTTPAAMLWELLSPQAKLKALLTPPVPPAPGDDPDPTVWVVDAPPPPIPRKLTPSLEMLSNNKRAWESMSPQEQMDHLNELAAFKSPEELALEDQKRLAQWNAYKRAEDEARRKALTQTASLKALATPDAQRFASLSPQEQQAEQMKLAAPMAEEIRKEKFVKARLEEFFKQKEAEYKVKEAAANVTAEQQIDYLEKVENAFKSKSLAQLVTQQAQEYERMSPQAQLQELQNIAAGRVEQPGEWDKMHPQAQFQQLQQIAAAPPKYAPLLKKAKPSKPAAAPARKASGDGKGLEYDATSRRSTGPLTTTRTDRQSRRSRRRSKSGQ